MVANVSGTTRELVVGAALKSALQVAKRLKAPDLDIDSAFGIRLDKYLAVIVPIRGVFGPNGSIEALLRSPMQLGVIVNCFGKVWYIESEPTIDNGFGMLVYAPQSRTNPHHRKPVMSGEGKVSTAKAGSASMRFGMKTVYDYVSSSPRRDKLSVSGSASKKGFTVKLIYSF